MKCAVGSVHTHGYMLSSLRDLLDSETSVRLISRVEQTSSLALFGEVPVNGTGGDACFTRSDVTEARREPRPLLVALPCRFVIYTVV